MSKHIITGQDDQINEIIERICEIAGKPLPIGATIAMIGKVIHLREIGAEEMTVRKQISGVTGIGYNDTRIDEIIFEIEEQPEQNTYLPFNISQFADLKSKLDREEE
jgi:hypothetical protein